MMEYVNLFLQYWIFFAAAAVLWGINESLKKAFPSPEERRGHAFVWALLPLWPVLIGGLFGLLNGSPVPSQLRTFGSLAGPLYFSCAGLMAIHVRDLVITYLKYFKPQYYNKDWHREDSLPPHSGV